MAINLGGYASQFGTDFINALTKAYVTREQRKQDALTKQQEYQTQSNLAVQKDLSDRLSKGEIGLEYKQPNIVSQISKESLGMIPAKENLTNPANFKSPEEYANFMVEYGKDIQERPSLGTVQGKVFESIPQKPLTGLGALKKGQEEGYDKLNIIPKEEKNKLQETLNTVKNMYGNNLPPGTTVTAGGVTIPLNPPEKLPTSEEKRNMAFGNVVNEKVNTIKKYVDKYPNVFNEIKIQANTPDFLSIVGKKFTTPEGRNAYNDTKVLLQNYIYSVSGKQINEKEFNIFADALLPSVWSNKEEFLGRLDALNKDAQIMASAGRPISQAEGQNRLQQIMSGSLQTSDNADNFMKDLGVK